MRIVVHVLFDLPSRTFLLHLHADDDVKVFRLACSLLVIAIHIELRVVGVLHVIACVTTILSFIYTSRHEVIIKFFYLVILAFKVYHRASLTFLIYKEKRRYIGIACYLSIICTECRSDMNNTRTVFGCNIVAEDNAESTLLHLYKLILAILSIENFLRMSLSVCLDKVCSVLVNLCRRLHPRHQLFVFHAFKVCSLIMGDDLIRYKLITFIIFRQFFAVGYLTFRSKICVDAGFRHHYRYLLTIIRIVCPYGHIVNFRTNTQCSIRTECPRSGCPSCEVRLAPCGKQ